MTDTNIDPDLQDLSPASPQAPQEKMVPQHVVDNAVKYAKREAYLKGQRDAVTPAQPAQAQPASTPQATETFGGMAQGQASGSVSPDDVQKMIQQHHAEIAKTQHIQQLGASLNQKFGASRDRYADFDSKIQTLDPDKNGHLFELANLVDNSGDVLHDLASNMGTDKDKIPAIEYWLQKNPQVAMSMIGQLSGSIKQNQAGEQAAKSQAGTPAPLSQITPSTTATPADSGRRNSANLRNLPEFRV